MRLAFDSSTQKSLNFVYWFGLILFAVWRVVKLWTFKIGRFYGKFTFSNKVINRSNTNRDFPLFSNISEGPLSKFSSLWLWVLLSDMCLTVSCWITENVLWMISENLRDWITNSPFAFYRNRFSLHINGHSFNRVGQ